MLANLKTALAARRVRQIDLALELKISPSFLSEILNERRQPNPSLRARIAEALDADERWLFACITRIPGPAKSSARGHS
jgi:transcriptional regulator with XRE-family HTH domain